jgi:RES domain-containing protein
MGYDFLSAFRKSAKARLATYQRGHQLWRAQVGYEWRREVVPVENGEGVGYDVRSPFSRERMSPDPKVVQDGRLNPRGIAYLYLADSPEVAIAEVRPWRGAVVSIGIFELLKDTVLVDCSKAEGSAFTGTFYMDGRYEPPPEAEWDDIVWGDIGYAFAVPADPNESHLTYAPTQILAEVLREEGYDGVLYRSAMHPSGSNITLFDTTRARLFRCELHEVSSVSYVSEEAEEGYSYKRETETPARTPPAEGEPSTGGGN